MRLVAAHFLLHLGQGEASVVRDGENGPHQGQAGGGSVKVECSEELEVIDEVRVDEDVDCGAYLRLISPTDFRPLC